MPHGLQAALYWFIAMTAFFGTWALATTLIAGISLVYSKARRWKHPHSITVTPTSGRTGNIILTHSGEPATWSVEGVIVSTLDGSPIPEALPFQCRLVKDGKWLWPMPLHHGEWAHVELATDEGDGVSTSWLSIIRHNADYNIHIPQTGVIVALTIKAIPPLKAGPTKKHFRVGERRLSHIEVVEVAPR
jgi:hypothetical protein